MVKGVKQRVNAGDVNKQINKYIMGFDFKSKKAKNKRNFSKAMDLNADRYGPSATQDKFSFTKLKMKKSPALAKLSSSCKAAARRKFDVYPSAYANMWASKTQKAGKC